jgi:hypothetical protein
MTRAPRDHVSEQRTPQAARDRYVAAAMGINLLPNTKPGEFTIAVTVKDAVGNQTYEAKQTFTVE